MTALHVFAAWFVASVPVGFALGAMMRRANRAKVSP